MTRAGDRARNAPLIGSSGFGRGDNGPRHAPPVSRLRSRPAPHPHITPHSRSVSHRRRCAARGSTAAAWALWVRGAALAIRAVLVRAGRELAALRARPCPCRRLWHVFAGDANTYFRRGHASARWEVCSPARSLGLVDGLRWRGARAGTGWAGLGWLEWRRTLPSLCAATLGVARSTLESRPQRCISVGAGEAAAG